MSPDACAWHGLSAEEHELQYNPQRAVPTFRDNQARREPLNAAANAALLPVRDIAYGPDPQETLDLYPAHLGAPVHVFFHGGYWRAQDKANFAFIAEALVRQGVTAAIANYPLCPRVTLDDVVRAARACVGWVLGHATQHGADPKTLTLSGHSAGAHLVAAVLADPTLAPQVKGALLISGIYDPAPAALTSVNADLHLTQDQIRRCDFERAPPHARCPVWIAAGGREPVHWIDQSFRYARHLHRHGLDPGVLVLPGYHHFDVIDQYADADSELMRCLAKLVARQGGAAAAT